MICPVNSFNADSPYPDRLIKTQPYTLFRKYFAVISKLTGWDLSVSHIIWLAFNTVLSAAVT